MAASFFMGWVKVVHFCEATAFALSVATRVIWMFLGNQYSHWNKFLPVSTRRWKAMLLILRYYFFQLRQPPGFVGHNPLAGFTYLFVFLMYLV
jgi:Ni/Fe-hydrogenase 1 B-type cytochrome subunit